MVALALDIVRNSATSDLLVIAYLTERASLEATTRFALTLHCLAACSQGSSTPSEPDVATLFAGAIGDPGSHPGPRATEERRTSLWGNT